MGLLLVRERLELTSRIRKDRSARTVCKESKEVRASGTGVLAHPIGMLEGFIVTCDMQVALKEQLEQTQELKSDLSAFDLAMDLCQLQPLQSATPAAPMMPMTPGTNVPFVCHPGHAVHMVRAESQPRQAWRLGVKNAAGVYVEELVSPRGTDHRP